MKFAAIGQISIRARRDEADRSSDEHCSERSSDV